MARKALLIGINYEGTSAALRGCINDVENMKAFIQSKGYTDITVLTDHTSVKPTRANILRALLDLILSGADKLFFHYSGHGTQVRDFNNDESDGKDEAIYCLDEQVITDDELRGLLACLGRRQTLVAVLDCCHSGSGFDLAFNLYDKVGSSAVTLVRDNKSLATTGRVVMLSGCQDPSTSADSWDSKKRQFAGALTKTVLQVLQTPQTWESLIKGVRTILKQEGFDQIPMLSSGRSLALSSSVSL